MTDASPPPASPATRHDRKARRLAVALASRVRYRGMAMAAITIRDLAFTGFRADCAVVLAGGERVSVDLPPFGLVPATIAWCRDGMIGGLFDAAVDIRHCVLKPGEPSYFAGGRRRPGGVAAPDL